MNPFIHSQILLPFLYQLSQHQIVHLGYIGQTSLHIVSLQKSSHALFLHVPPKLCLLFCPHTATGSIWKIFLYYFSKTLTVFSCSWARLLFQGSTSLIHFSIYQFIHSVFPIDSYLIHGVQLGLDVVQTMKTIYQYRRSS